MKSRHSSLLALFIMLLFGFGAACRATTSPRDAGINVAPPNAVGPSTPKAKPLKNVGFATRNKWLEHFDKHGREFGAITADEYLSQAQTLRDRPVDANVLESVRRDGVITRFDQQTGAFLAFNEDLTIRTYFKPNDGANYFWRQSKR